MKIRLATPDDFPAMTEMDGDDGQWDADDVVEFVKALGVVKVATEGGWPLGWAAFRREDGVTIVERLVARDDGECEVALRLTRHVERLAAGCRAVRVVVPERNLHTVKVLAGIGYRAAPLRDFFGDSDAVALHRNLSPA